MMRLLRAPLIISTLSLLLFLGASVPQAHAQTQEEANAFARIISIMLTADKAQIPNAGMDETVEFTYKGLSCTRVGPHMTRASVTPGSITCKQTAPALTASCSGDTDGLRFSCSIKKTDGSIIQIDGSNTFTPNAVGEDRVINDDGQQVGETTGTPIKEGGDGKCGMLDVACAVLKIPGLILSGVAYAILVLSTFVLFVAGTVFNWVVIRTVFQFAVYFGTSAGMLVAWGVLRDIANIALLFGFIFMGIATILNTQNMEGYSAKKALPRLIIFAVLLNFSLFATQGIIDIANGFGSIFSTYAGQGCEEAADGGQSSETCANVGISGKIMAAAGMNHFPTAEGFMGTLEKPYSTAAMLIILSILVSITAMVLFAASIMLVTRVVVLSILMVTSPIGFAGLAIPSLQKIAKDWWHKLINQAFFAPLYLLMVFISLKLVDGLQQGGASIPDAISGNVSGGGTLAGNMQVLVVYAIVIGFMVGSLIISQKMGAAGASFATKTAGGLAFGAQGFVARRTVGRVSALAAQKVAGSKWAEKNPGLARLAYGGLNKGATASFSSRNLMGGVLKGAGAGVDIGKANATAGHGYHGIEEKAEKERLEFAKKLTDRKETDEEYKTRMDKHRANSEKNARDMAQGEAAVPLAQEEKAAAEATIVTANQAKVVAEEHLATRRIALEAQREFASQNPTDQAAQLALQQEEANVARANDELRQADAGVVEASNGLVRADTKLSIATKALAAAKETRAKLAKESADKLTIKSKDRQETYANSMVKKNKGLWGVATGTYDITTAAGHANHAAAAKILKNANKDEMDIAWDKMKEAMKKEKGEKKDEHEDKHEEEHAPTNNSHPPTSDPHH